MSKADSSSRKIGELKRKGCIHEQFARTDNWGELHMNSAGKGRIFNSKARLAATSLIATATLAGGLVLNAGSASAAGPKWETISIGIALSPPKVIFMAPYVAQVEGFFAREHLNVKFISMPNGLQTELGTTSGSINFGLSSATDAIESAAVGAPIRAIASYGLTLDTECIAAPGITSAKDLIGQPVGSTGADGFSVTTLAACLAPGGVTISQTKPITMTRSEFVGALTTGAIKVAVFHADDAYVVLHSLPGASVLEKQYSALPNWWYGGITALNSYTRTHVSVTKRFLTAMTLADRWMNNKKNTNKLVQIAVKNTSEDIGAVRSAVSFLQAAKTWPNNVGLPRASVQYTTQQLFNLKTITTHPTFDQIVNPKYMNAVIKQMGKVPGN